MASSGRKWQTSTLIKSQFWTTRSTRKNNANNIFRMPTKNHFAQVELERFAYLYSLDYSFFVIGRN
jgi:hypothetical protein